MLHRVGQRFARRLALPPIVTLARVMSGHSHSNVVKALAAALFSWPNCSAIRSLPMSIGLPVGFVRDLAGQRMSIEAVHAEKPDLHVRCLTRRCAGAAPCTGFHADRLRRAPLDRDDGNLIARASSQRSPAQRAAHCRASPAQPTRPSARLCSAMRCTAPRPRRRKLAGRARHVEWRSPPTRSSLAARAGGDSRVPRFAKAVVSPVVAYALSLDFIPVLG
jgi:hypothetical protein